MVTTLGSSTLDPNHPENGGGINYVAYDTTTDRATANSSTPYPPYSSHNYDRGLVFEVTRPPGSLPQTLTFPNDFVACQFGISIGPDEPTNLRRRVLRPQGLPVSERKHRHGGDGWGELRLGLVQPGADRPHLRDHHHAGQLELQRQLLAVSLTDFEARGFQAGRP